MPAVPGKALAIVLALLGGAACSRHAPPPPVARSLLPASPAVRALLEERARALPSSGLVAGLLDAGGRRVVAAGTSRGPGSPPPGGRSVFEIGSVTKVITGVLLADMAFRGEVRLDEPVASLLPAGVRVPSFQGRAITLVDLATQSSGLPRSAANMAPRDLSNPYADYTEAQLYGFLSTYELPRAPGAQFEYSNLGMGLLGLALGRRAGSGYERLVTSRILDPLGLHDTRITLSPEQRGRLVPGHDEGGAVVPNWDVPTLAGAGALRSTAADLLDFLAASLAASAGRDPGGLGRAMRAAQTPRRPAASPGMSIGLGWHVHNPSHIVWHNGGTGGYRAFVGLVPDRGTAVVLLASSTGSLDDIGLHLLDPTLRLRAH